MPIQKNQINNGVIKEPSNDGNLTEIRSNKNKKNGNESNEQISNSKLDNDVEFLLSLFQTDYDVFSFFKKKVNKIIAIFTILLFSLSIIAVSLLQYKNYELAINTDNNSLAALADVCNIIDFSNFNLISNSLALILILLYSFIYSRQKCCLNCFYGKPMVPMVVSPFKKFNRFYTAILYGVIAAGVYKVVESVIEQSSASDVYGGLVKDPSGLFKFTMRLIEVLIVAIRYYPPLIAFHANSVFIYISSAIYMWIDLGVTIYVEGVCDGLEGDVEEYMLAITYFGVGQVAYSFVKDFPHFFCLSLVVSILTIKGFYLIFAKDTRKKESAIFLKEDKRFFSKFDIYYCIDLLKRNCSEVESESQNNGDIKTSFKTKILNLFQKYIYKWDENFRYTSRVVNTYVSAYLALYYCFIIWFYFGFHYFKGLLNKVTNQLTDLIMVINTNDIDLGLPSIYVKNQYLAAFIVPAILSFIICNIQIFFSLKGIKTNLLKMYRGDYNSLPNKNRLSNVSIATSNSHFGGFVIGYIIWGYLFIFACLFAISIIFIFMDQIISGEDVLDFFLFILPFLVVFIVKFILNFFFSKFVFLQEYGKILAINNYRAYRIYIFITFFLDCFFGVVGAIIRIIKAIIASILFMPRIDYSAIGRQLETFDSGFSSYVGFLYIEAHQTNPIVITFCALIYYKRLLAKENDDKNETNIENEIRDKKLKPIMNKIRKRWLVAITLTRNSNLVKYRKKKCLKKE